MRIAKFSFTALIALTLSGITNHRVCGQARETIAVVPFSGPANDHGARLALENAIVERLLAMKRFQVVERSQLEKIFGEQRLSLTGVISDSAAIAVGKLLGAKYLAVGMVSTRIDTVERRNPQYDPRWPTAFPRTIVWRQAVITGDIRIVQTETASIQGSLADGGDFETWLKGGHSTEVLIREAARKLATKFYQRVLRKVFPLEGYIIKVLERGHRSVGAIIDIGSEKGVQQLEKFIVFRGGEGIKHPVTGQLIQGPIQPLGVAGVIWVDVATSTVSIETENEIRVGDRVKSHEYEF